MARGRSWSQCEQAYLLKNYNKISISQLAIYTSHANKTVQKEYEKLSGKPGKKGKKKAQVIPTSASGKRPDLDKFFRSKWESNWARILNYIKQYGTKTLSNRVKEWQYEPYTFWFDENKKLKLKAIKRGNRHYTCDFHIDFIDGTDCWLEVKGYLRPGDRTKLKRFKKWFPEDFKKLWVLVGSDKTEAYRFFKEKLLVPKKQILLYKDLTLKYKSLIQYWER